MNNREHLYNIIQSKQRYILCKELFSDISELPYAIIKGEPLSLLCYNGYGYRNSSDIDILIPKKYIAVLEQALQKNGFHSINEEKSSSTKRLEHIFCLSGSHQTVPYVKKGNNHYVEVDINFDIYWGEFNGLRIDMSTFLLDTIDINIYGFTVKTLPKIKALLQLCLHHYKEMNSLFHLSSHNCIKTSMFKDVFYLLNNTSDISPETLYAISEEYGVTNYIFYILYYTYQVFPSDVLKKYLDCLSTNEGIELLNKYGLSKDEQKEWRYPFSERLDNPNLYQLIKNDLTESDIDKIQRNITIFK